MKKRILSILLSVTLCLTLAACGGSKPAETAEKPAAEQAQSAEKAEPAEQTGTASDWPSDTVSLYVPAKAGGGTDLMARLFAQGLAESTGGNFIVVNDVTGGGTVAAETVRNDKSDGLNLLAYHSGLCSAIASGQYAHSLDEFTLIGAFISVPPEASGAIFVPGNSPFNTLQDLVDYAKDHPDELVTGVQNGSASQLIWGVIENELGISCTKVEAGSNADKVTALMGNQLDVVFMNTTGNQQYVESGDLKALAVCGGTERSPLMPDAPLLTELGYEDVHLNNIGYIAGPKDMDPATVSAISEAMKAATENAAVQEGYKKLAAVVEWVSPEEITEMMKTEQENYNAAYELVFK